MYVYVYIDMLLDFRTLFTFAEPILFFHINVFRVSLIPSFSKCCRK